MPTSFPSPVAVISFDTAKQLAKFNKKAFTHESTNKFFTYPQVAEANLDDTEYDINNITSAENDEMSEVTYNATDRSWPFIKGRKMY